MKTKSILALALTFILSTSIAWAGDASPAAAPYTITSEKKAPLEFNIVNKVDLKKDAIFDNTIQFLAQYFVSAHDVIQVQDKANGIIIAKIILVSTTPIPFGEVKHDVKITMKIEIKDNKYRASFSNIMIPEAASTFWDGLIRTGDDGSYIVSDNQAIVIKPCVELMDKLQAYLVKASTNNEF